VTTASDVEILTPREVPLGGLRAMTVRRTLPQRQRSLIGAWCFLDHYGPDQVADTGGMSVAPHPHTGLQTVSWLFTGEIEHRDSAGNHAMVRPGELNLMTAGHGISHSEVSTPGTTTLHGAQLWVALPEAARDGAPGFDHYAPPEVPGEGWAVRVFLGSLLGSTSPVATATPLLGAEVRLDADAELVVDVEAAYEHGVLVDTGLVHLDDAPVAKDELAFVPAGPSRLTLRAGADGARLLLLGGPPFGEPIVMWWNFVGRTHEEVVAYREAWQAQILDDEGEERHPEDAGGLPEAGEGERVVRDGQQVRPGRFGVVVGEQLAPIPAPPLPNARLRQRG
jgi:redox-sensitive bicupin YhaK (pirin superfamily)